MQLTLATIAAALQADFTGQPDTLVSGVQFDSRQVTAGDLFVALVAENDGHHYIENALASGAVAILADEAHREMMSADWPVIFVADTLKGLQDLAVWYRDQVAPKVIAITGSNGKTTTKDMTAAIMASQYKTFKTPENFNNEIGVPMTLLQMPVETEVLVVELGMDRAGQLTDLSRMVKPDVAVITMIGEAHIEFFKTRERIAQAKLEILNGLQPNGTVIIPANEPLLTQPVQHIAQTVQTFGIDDDADVYAQQITTLENQTTFEVAGETFAIPLLGLYNVMNALAALSSGQRLGLSWAQMSPALTNFQLTKMRTEWLTMPNGTRLLSDVYNSNPTAVSAVIATFKAVNAPVKRVVLGDMLELGEAAGDLHAQIAADLNPRDIQAVYLVGPLMATHLYPLLQDKYLPEQLHVYDKDELSQLSADLNAHLSPTDVVLLKGSHGIHLETVVSTLTEA